MKLLPGYWAIAPDAFAGLCAAWAERSIDVRPRGGEYGPGREGSPYLAYAVEGGVARLYIRGVLYSDSADWLDVALFAPGIRYSAIVAAARAAVEDTNVQRLHYDWETPGGEIAGLWEAAEELRRLSSIKPASSHVRGACCSSGMVLAAAVGPISAGPMSVLGSLGVMAEVVDQTERDRQMGLKRTVVVSAISPRKHVDPSAPGGLDDVQARIDAMGLVFVETFARYRGLGVQAVIDNAGKGAPLIGQAALDAGLIDEILAPHDAVPLACREAPEVEASVDVSPPSPPGTPRAITQEVPMSGTNTGANTPDTASELEQLRAENKRLAAEAAQARVEALAKGAETTALEQLQKQVAELTAAKERDLDEAMLAKHVAEGTINPADLAALREDVKVLGRDAVDRILGRATSKARPLGRTTQSGPVEETASPYVAAAKLAREKGLDYDDALASLGVRQPAEV